MHDDRGGRGEQGSVSGEQLLSLGGQQWPFAASTRGGTLHDVTLDRRRWPLSVYAVGERISVFAPEGAATLHEIDPNANVIADLKRVILPEEVAAAPQRRSLFGFRRKSAS